MRECHPGRPLGRVVELWRYPVKSMAAEPLAQGDVSWHGLAGDRRWAFIRDGVTQSGFPWLTLREREDMTHYRPSFTDPTEPDKSPTIVRTPSGSVVDVTDPALGAELHPQGARVIKQNRGIFDTFPLSLITTQTIARLSEIVGARLDVQRFRPNIVVEAAEQAPFVEDGWVGCVLQIGGMSMRIDKRDGRCAVITIDPVTTERNPAVLRAVARDRQGCLGVYGSTVEPGRVAVDDLVRLAALPREPFMSTALHQTSAVLRHGS
jgi:MOSC domain-containing protein